MGGGPSPQYAVAVRIVPSGYGKLASTRHRSAATRSSALMSSAPPGLAKPPASTAVPGGDVTATARDARGTLENAS